MKLDNDCRQYITVIVSVLLQLYKVGMGTFLLFFVPQKCDTHTCEIRELIHTQDLYMKIGFLWNAFTLIMCLFTYMWELKRERWCIKHLDNEKGIAYNNLQYILREKPLLNNQLCSLNVHYIRSLRLTSTVILINFIQSGYLIYPHYLDISTVTSYLSFALLLLMKLSNSYNVGAESYRKNLALSAYMTEPLTFNALDFDLWRENGNANVPLTYGYESLQA